MTLIFFLKGKMINTETKIDFDSIVFQAVDLVKLVKLAATNQNKLSTDSLILLLSELNTYLEIITKNQNKIKNGLNLLYIRASSIPKIEHQETQKLTDLIENFNYYLAILESIVRK
jgi:hypothetical protein